MYQNRCRGLTPVSNTSVRSSRTRYDIFNTCSYARDFFVCFLSYLFVPRVVWAKAITLDVNIMTVQSLISRLHLQYILDNNGTYFLSTASFEYLREEVGLPPPLLSCCCCCCCCCERAEPPPPERERGRLPR